MNEVGFLDPRWLPLVRARRRRPCSSARRARSPRPDAARARRRRRATRASRDACPSRALHAPRHTFCREILSRLTLASPAHPRANLRRRRRGDGGPQVRQLQEGGDIGDTIAIILGVLIILTAVCAFLGWYSRRRG